MGLMNRSYLTGRLVKSGPTKVGLVIMRFHPGKNSKPSVPPHLLHQKLLGTFLRSFLSGLDNLEHFLLSNAPDLW